jgi:protease I
MPKRIAVLVTNNFEDQEYSEPVKALLAARHSICNIELHAGKVVYGLHGQSRVTIDRSIDHISIDDFDALLIPGGESPLVLAHDARVLRFIQAFNQARKTIFSLCDASLLLSEANVLKDRIITSIRAHASRVQHAGATYYDVELVNDNNQLISSRVPNDLPIFIHECLNVLKS